MSTAESVGDHRAERSLSPSGILEREEARANMARQRLLVEYRAIQAKTRLLVKQDDALKEEYLLVIRENQELESTCNKAIAAEHETAEQLKIAESGCRDLYLLVDYLEPTLIKEKELVSELRAELSLLTNQSLPDTLELRQTQARLQDLQDRYDNLCTTHTEAEQRRKVDIQKWMELKTRLESDNAKLKAALKKEKAKTAAARAEENAKTGKADQHQQFDENESKYQIHGRSAGAAFSDRREARTPLRTVGTPVKRVQNARTTSPGDRGQERDVPIDQLLALDQGVAQGASLVSVNSAKTLPHVNIFRPQHSSTERLDPDGPRNRTGLVDGVREAGSSSERERTVTERAMDTLDEISRAPEHSLRTLAQQAPTPADLPDIEGSATEEDEEMPLVRKAVPTRVKSTDRASVSRLSSRGNLDPGQFESSRSGNQFSQLRTPDVSKTTFEPSRHTPGIATNTVGDTRKAILSSNRTGRSSTTRLDRTPSGLHWLGGEKSKTSRRDSFEDEVSPGTRGQLKQEVTAALPRPSTRRPNAGSHICVTNSRLPGERQLRIGDTSDTPTRTSGTISKRKREAFPQTPSIALKGSKSTPRSDKKPRLTASDTPPVELRKDDVYVINPKANGGKSYTFHSVERNKERRQCMHGEACHECDAWYDATSDIQHVPAIRFGATPSPQSLIDEDQEELAQAQRQKLMDSVSRHKVEHEKNPTPPGYWEPGMPSTQAVERQNIAADAMLQAKRERQRREANKGDGKWMIYNKDSESLIRSSRKS